nr:unnamed protein product [Callosobruchus analis]
MASYFSHIILVGKDNS